MQGSDNKLIKFDYSVSRSRSLLDLHNNFLSGKHILTFFDQLLFSLSQTVHLNFLLILLELSCENACVAVRESVTLFTGRKEYFIVSSVGALTRLVGCHLEFAGPLDIHTGIYRGVPAGRHGCIEEIVPTRRLYTVSCNIIYYYFIIVGMRPD